MLKMKVKICANLKHVVKKYESISESSLHNGPGIMEYKHKNNSVTLSNIKPW